MNSIATEPSVEDLKAAQQRNRERAGTVTHSEPDRIGDVLRRSTATRTFEDRLADPDWQERQRRKRAERERQEAERERANRQGAWASLARKIGKRHAGCTLDNFVAETPDQQQAVEAARRFHADLAERIERGCNLLIYGPVGTGKDHLMTPLLRHAVRDVGASAVWENGRNLWREQRDWIGAKKRELDLARRYIRPRLLMLSDPSLGGKPLSAFEQDFLYLVIDERYRHCRSTWLTVNAAGRAEMEQQIGVPTVDRLGQDCIAIHCDWQSYRRQPNHEPANNHE